MNEWFEDPLTPEEIAESIKEDDPWMKVDLYKIYNNDKLAKQVFKNLYNLKWAVNEKCDGTIELMIKLMKLSEQNTTTEKNKENIITRLFNIALLGTIRFYHLERHPFLKQSQVQHVMKYFFKVLSLINDIKYGKYKNKEKYKNIQGEIYIFKSLDTFSDENPPEKENDLKDKSKDES